MSILDLNEDIFITIQKRLIMRTVHCPVRFNNMSDICQLRLHSYYHSVLIVMNLQIRQVFVGRYGFSNSLI